MMSRKRCHSCLLVFASHWGCPIVWGVSSICRVSGYVPSTNEQVVSTRPLVPLEDASEIGVAVRQVAECQLWSRSVPSPSSWPPIASSLVCPMANAAVMLWCTPPPRWWGVSSAREMFCKSCVHLVNRPVHLVTPNLHPFSSCCFSATLFPSKCVLHSVCLTTQV